MTTSNTPESNPATDLLQSVMDMEEKRRKEHRRLSTRAYTIQPMNGPDAVGDFEVITFTELLALVSDFNHGRLPHSDDWFSIEDTISGEVYKMNLFYQFIK